MSEDSTVGTRSGDRGDPALPQHPDVALWRTATRADVDAIHGIFAAADAVDHPSWVTPREEIADTFDLPHIDHARDTLIGFAEDGRAIAAGSSFLHPSRNEKLSVHLAGSVHPDWRRRGIGRELFDWQNTRAEQQVADAAASLAEPLPVELKTYAEAVNAGHQALAAAFGFAPERWFATMVRQRSEVPDVTQPDGVEVVAYSSDREDDAREARNDAFRDHWGSLPSTREGWAKFVGSEFFRADLSRVVLDGDRRIIAFCLVTVNHDDWEARGRSNAYIDLIGVVRDRRRQGLAPLVISRALHAIADADIDEAILDVDTESPTGANTLYSGLGFVAEERSVALVRHL
ncbi:GNAT family N-acetyltransferase [Microbacterium invictum]|uniref:GNAT family N-acetyltransferase n=1 Tax=Microbacterium invictum TaxID=515415 RepID=A0ABZ0VB40_9MICO|nr:GNAT family N-acetyltransferase [Microbacterium invictum]WQB70339.1 GNAT family N-acetyltransferase [Microbacterium invictum]